MQPGKSMMESLESSINKVLYLVPSYRGAIADGTYQISRYKMGVYCTN